MAGEIMIDSIIQLILGIAFFAFLPGYFIVKLFFDEQETYEQILLAVVFSIMIAIAIGIFFGYDRAQAVRTGGFTVKNLWTGEIAVTSLAAIAYLVKLTLAKRRTAAKQTTKPRRKKR